MGMYCIRSRSSSNDICMKFNNDGYPLRNQPQSIVADGITPGWIYVETRGNGIWFSMFIATLTIKHF